MEEEFYENTFDPFMLHLFAALAEKERRLISERTRAALQAKKVAGARLGNPVDLKEAGSLGRTVQSAAAARFVEGMVPQLSAIRKNGVTSLAEIADALNERGVQPAKRGDLASLGRAKRFSASEVLRNLVAFIGGRFV